MIDYNNFKKSLKSLEVQNQNDKKWSSFLLLDIVNIVGGGTPKTTIKEYWDGEIPWLTVADFNNNYRMVFDTQKKITRLGLNNSSTNLLKEGDVVISARGTVGCLTQVAREMTFNQSCYGLRGKEGKILNDYLYYMLKFEISKLKKMSYGSVFSTITTNTLKKLNITIPASILEQKKISTILVELDTKIQLNFHINKILEEITQTIFKSWFVDFDPVHAKKRALEKGLSKKQAERAAMAIISGICSPSEFAENFKEMDQRLTQKLSNMEKEHQEELAHTTSLFPSEFEDSELGKIPRNWSCIKINELFEVRDGTHDSPKKSNEGFHLITSRHIIGGKLDTSKSYLISEEDYIKINKRSKVDVNDILITMIGTVGETLLIMNEPNYAIKNIGLFKTSQNHKWRFYMDQCLKCSKMERYMKARLAGTTQKYLSLTELRNLPILKISQDLLSVFNNLVCANYELINSNRIKNQTLESLRDTLLPKLLVGEIDLSNIQIDDNSPHTIGWVYI